MKKRGGGRNTYGSVMEKKNAAKDVQARGAMYW